MKMLRVSHNVLVCISSRPFYLSSKLSTSKFGELFVMTGRARIVTGCTCFSTGILASLSEYSSVRVDNLLLLLLCILPQNATFPHQQLSSPDANGHLILTSLPMCPPWGTAFAPLRAALVFFSVPVVVTCTLTHAPGAPPRPLSRPKHRPPELPEEFLVDNEQHRPRQRHRPPGLQLIARARKPRQAGPHASCSLNVCSQCTTAPVNTRPQCVLIYYE